MLFVVSAREPGGKTLVARYDVEGIVLVGEFDDPDDAHAYVEFSAASDTALVSLDRLPDDMMQALERLR